MTSSSPKVAPLAATDRAFRRESHAPRRAQRVHASPRSAHELPTRGTSPTLRRLALVSLGYTCEVQKEVLGSNRCTSPMRPTSGAPHRIDNGFRNPPGDGKAAEPISRSRGREL